MDSLELNQEAARQYAVMDLIKKHGIIHGWHHKWNTGHGMASAESMGFLSQKSAMENMKEVLTDLGYTVPKWWQWWRWGENVPVCFQRTGKEIAE